MAVRLSGVLGRSPLGSFVLGALPRATTPVVPPPPIIVGPLALQLLEGRPMDWVQARPLIPAPNRLETVPARSLVPVATRLEAVPARAVEAVECLRAEQVPPRNAVPSEKGRMEADPSRTVSTKVLRMERK